MNVGDKVKYKLTALDRGYLNRRLAENEERWELEDTTEAVVVAIYDNDVLDLDIPELYETPWNQARISKGEYVGQWSE